MNVSVLSELNCSQLIELISWNRLVHSDNDNDIDNILFDHNVQIEITIFLVNKGIYLILIIQTFYPSTLSVLYSKDVHQTSFIVSSTTFPFIAVKSHYGFAKQYHIIATLNAVLLQSHIINRSGDDHKDKLICRYHNIHK